MQISEIKENETKNAINQAFKGLTEAAKSLDVNQYAEFFYKEKFTALNADGTVTHSFEEFINGYSEGISALESYESLEFKNVKITVANSTTAILVNEYDAVVVLKSGDKVSAKGAGTQVWSKENGTWKLVSVSSSSKSE